MDSTLVLHWESLNGLRRLAIHKVRNNLSMLRVEGEQQAIDLGYDGIVPGTAGTAREDHHPLETKPKYEPQTHGPVCPEAVHDSSLGKRGGGKPDRVFVARIWAWLPCRPTPRGSAPTPMHRRCGETTIHKGSRVSRRLPRQQPSAHRPTFSPSSWAAVPSHLLPCVCAPGATSKYCLTGCRSSLSLPQNL